MRAPSSGVVGGFPCARSRVVASFLHFLRFPVFLQRWTTTFRLHLKCTPCIVWLYCGRVVSLVFGSSGLEGMSRAELVDTCYHPCLRRPPRPG